MGKIVLKKTSTYLSRANPSDRIHECCSKPYLKKLSGREVSMFPDKSTLTKFGT